MKTTNELHEIIQNLRDALIEAKCAAGVWKTQANIIPNAVNDKLAEIETNIHHALERNKIW
jgi:hypothetical protein